MWHTLSQNSQAKNYNEHMTIILYEDVQSNNRLINIFQKQIKISNLLLLENLQNLSIGNIQVLVHTQ